MKEKINNLIILKLIISHQDIIRVIFKKKKKIRVIFATHKTDISKYVACYTLILEMYKEVLHVEKEIKATTTKWAKNLNGSFMEVKRK